MHLTHCARIHPEQSCEIVLLPAEWKLLRRKFEPKNRSKQPPTLHQVVGWIARLGGFLARKNDGEPGLKTIRRGIGVLHHLQRRFAANPQNLVSDSYPAVFA
jgi:hypothetical protein